MKYFLVSLISLLFLYVCGNAYSADRCIDGYLCSVTIIHLISNPELYDKKEVIVRGYFVYDEEQSNLYLDSEKAKYGLSEYSINLNFVGTETKDISKKSGDYALIHGVFNQNDRGMGIPTAGSVAVTRFGSP